MQCRRRGRRRCLLRCYPRLAWRNREAATQYGPPASAAALAFFVGRFGVGDALLELAPRLTRRFTPRLIRVRHSAPLVVDSIESCFDALLDTLAHLTELVGNVAADVLDKTLRVLLHPPGAARYAASRLLTGLGGKEQSGSGAERDSKEERTDADLALLDDDIRRVKFFVFVVEIGLVELFVLIPGSPSHRTDPPRFQFFAKLLSNYRFFAFDFAAAGAFDGFATFPAAGLASFGGCAPFEPVGAASGFPFSNAAISARTSAADMPTMVAVRL